MPVHKTIFGGEQYTPFALNKLRQLAAEAARTGGFGSRTFQIGDVQIRLRVALDQHFVTITESGSFFDFCYTGPVLHAKGASILGHVIRVSYSGGVLKPRRVGSNVELVAGQEDAKYEPAKSLASIFPLKFFQINGLIEPRYHSKSQPGWQVMYSWGANTQFSRMLNMSPAGSYQGYQAYDVYYDLAPSNWKNRRSGAAKDSRPLTDFYRSAATTTVNGISYMLMVDTHNRLHVWSHDQPLIEGAADQPHGEATIAFYQSVQLPLPAWAEQSGIWRNLPIVDGMVDIPYSGYPHYKWEFDSTGTRLVAVVPEDTGYVPPVMVDVTPTSGTPVYLRDSENAILRTVSLGMVEFNLAITPNFEGPQREPSVSVSLGRTIRPSTSGRYILAAAYGWDLGNAAVSQDDLLLVEQQLYVKDPDAVSPDRYFVTVIPLPPARETRADGCHETRFLIKNETRATTIRNFCMRKLIQKPIVDPGALTEPYERIDMSSTMLALDLKTLSYAFETMLRRMSTDASVAQTESRSLYGEFKTPRKYRAYHNNKVVHDSSVGTDTYTLTDPAIASSDLLYAAVFEGSTPTGTLLAANAKVTIGTGITGYGDMFAGVSIEGLTEFTPGQESISKRLRSADISSTYITWQDYPFGSIEHGYGASRLWPDPWGGYVCHPEGHFSLCLGPLEAYTAATSASAPTDPAYMSFGFIDIFRFKTGVDQDGNDTEIVTTNLALANEACGTNHTVQDFYDQAEFYAPPPSPAYAFLIGGTRVRYVQDGAATAQPPAPGLLTMYPTADRSLRGLAAFGHQSTLRSSPRKHPMWVGNFNPKLLAAGWNNTEAP